jgi:glycosyltransferase involved in cell wall biosynthesis
VRVLVFMPRNMRFGPSNASSVDLCVRDLIAASRYRASTTVVCCENETLFADIDVTTYSSEIDRHKHRKVAFAVKEAKRRSVDLVVVQQHLPTAAALARRIDVPVVFHKHNITSSIPDGSLLSTLRRAWRLRQYRSLAGIIFVSDACQAAFRRDWPEVRTSTATVYNGLDFSEWQPAGERAKEILCVGRAAPEKGIKEAATAMAAALGPADGWQGRLVLSEPNRFPGYLEEVHAALAPVASRVTIEFSQPISVVRQRFESAAIAIIPSKWEEPFGRTALEAHAGGCAVVSSGTGGLREISAEHALFLPQNFDATDIAERLKVLMADDGLRTALAQKGRDYCRDKFSVGAVSSAADGFYDRVARVRR